MATLTQVNQIINDINVVDRTAEGAESAAHNLDLIQDRGDAVTESLEKMGATGGEAAQAVAKSTGTAAEALEGVAARGVRSLGDLKKSVRDLRAEEKSLQEQLNQANGSGADTSDITSRLSRTQAELKGTAEAYQVLQRTQRAAADAQAAQNGEFNEANALLTSARDTILSVGQAGAQTFGALRAGVDGSTRNFLSLAASVDTISKKMREVENAENRLESLRASSQGALAAGNVSPEDAERAIRSQESLVAAKKSELAVERERHSLSGQQAAEQERQADALRQNTALEQAFLRTAASAGDEVARTTVELNNQRSVLEKMRAQGAVLVSNGTMTQADADGYIAPQQARVDQKQKEVDAARQVRTALEQEAAGRIKNAAAAKLESYQVTILMEEAHKFADMVMAGGSMTKAAFYEVPNAVGVLGGFGKTTQIVTGLLSGPGGLVAAAAAVGVAFAGMGVMAEHEESRIAKLSTQLRATREDAVAMAGTIQTAGDALKNRPGWNEDTARQAATTFGSTYNFTGGTTDITALAGIARDAGEIFGGLENGLKAVQTAMVDPTAEIEALYKQHLPGVDKALVEQVRNLQASGRQGDAYAVVIDHIREASKGAHEQALTPFQQALEEFKKAGAPAASILGDFASAIGRLTLQLSTWLLQHANTALSHLADPDMPSNTDVGLGGRLPLDNFVAGHHHIGIGQVDPLYAGKNDITTPEGNVAAMIDSYVESKRIMGGKIDGALAHYSGNKPGSLGAQNYASAVYRADHRQMPQDTYNLIKAEEDKRPDLSSADRSVIFGIAMHESGGHQFRDWKGAPAPSPARDVATQHATSAAVIDNTKSVAGGSAEVGGGYSSTSWSEQRAGIEAYIQSQTTLAQTQKAGSAAWQETQEKITSARVALANTLSPQEKITQGLQDGLEPLKAQSGYWRSMGEVVAQFGQTARGTGVDQQALAGAMSAKQRQLAAAYDDGTQAAERQAQSQQGSIAAAGASASALQHATNHQQAYTEAQNDFDEKSPRFAEAVQRRTAALDRLSDSQKRGQQIQQNSGLQDNLTLIQAETASIGQNADQRQVNLAIMQAELAMHRQYGDILPQEAQDYIDLTGKVATATVAYQTQQNAVNELSNDISSMADTLSSAFTQAFLNASNGAISFKSALSGIESQIVSLIAKYAFINPVKNELDGGHLNTLWNMGGLLGGSASNGGEFGGGPVGDDPFGGSGTSASAFSGGGAGALGGIAGLASVARGGSGAMGLFGSGGLSSFMKTPVFGHATVGGLLGGVGGGFALGSMLGKIGGGTYGTIGSGAGSLIGAGIGSFFPGAGTIIGGIAGGGLGGLFGGLFSKSHYAYDQVSGANGHLAISSTRLKHADDDVTAGLQSQLDALNATYSSLGVTVGAGNFGEVGHYHRGKKQSSTTFESLLGGIGLHSDSHTYDQALHSTLMPKTFDSVGTYQQTLTQLKQMSVSIDQLGVSVEKFNTDSSVTVQGFTKQTGDLRHALDHVLDGKTLSVSDLQTQVGQITTFVTDTMPGLMSATVSGQQAWVDQMADLKKQYDAAATTATSYGLDGASVSAKYLDIYNARYAQNVTSLNQSDAAVRVRYLTAQGDDQGAALLSFDTGADQQRASLRDSWKSFLGDAYTTQQGYLTQSADLEKTLAAERLAIQAQYNGTAIAQLKQYHDQAQQSVTSVFSGLTDYARGLSTSDASPLSLQDRYAAANDNLTRDYQAAQNGNFDALSRIQNDIQQHLALSRSWQGSGSGYAQDYRRDLSFLNTLGQSDTTALTAALAKKLSEDQTQTLNASVQQLVSLTTSLLGEARQQGMKQITGKAA